MGCSLQPLSLLERALFPIALSHRFDGLSARPNPPEIADSVQKFSIFYEFPLAFD